MRLVQKGSGPVSAAAGVVFAQKGEGPTELLERTETSLLESRPAAHNPPVDKTIVTAGK